MRAILTNLMMRRPAATASHNKNIFRLVSVITKIMPHKKLIASYRYVKNRNMSFLLLPWPCIPPTIFSTKIYTKLSRLSVYQIMCGLFLVITFFRGLNESINGYWFFHSYFYKKIDYYKKEKIWINKTNVFINFNSVWENQNYS